jgi:hypothetical protein
MPERRALESDKSRLQPVAVRSEGLRWITSLSKLVRKARAGRTLRNAVALFF